MYININIYIQGVARKVRHRGTFCSIWIDLSIELPIELAIALPIALPIELAIQLLIELRIKVAPADLGFGFLLKCLFTGSLNCRLALLCSMIGSLQSIVCLNRIIEYIRSKAIAYCIANCIGG